MIPAPPIDVQPWWGRLHAHLLDLLRGLAAEDWARPVPSSRWTVKDVVAHLLDGDLRRLSFQRDRWPPPPPEGPFDSPADLVSFLNRLNADWIRAARRLSPGVLVELLAWSGPEVERLFASLDPEAPALFAVAWAAEETSAHWMDIAREYTEKWVHQQQIRDALGQPGPGDPALLRPVLEAFLRAVPAACSELEAEIGAAEGAALGISISGDGGGEWAVRRDESGWRLYEGFPPTPAARVRAPAEAAWRLLATRHHKERHLAAVEVEGDSALARGFLEACAVMA